MLGVWLDLQRDRASVLRTAPLHRPTYTIGEKAREWCDVSVDAGAVERAKIRISVVDDSLNGTHETASHPPVGKPAPRWRKRPT